MDRVVNLTLSIRKIERGYIATFSRAMIGEMGDEYAALAPADLRNCVDEELRVRLNSMIDQLMHEDDTP